MCDVNSSTHNNRILLPKRPSAPVLPPGRDLARTERLSSPFIVVLGLLIEGAALFHDVGKAAKIFLDKLSPNTGPIADPVRHEVISALVLKTITERHQSDRGWIAELSSPQTAAAAIRDAWNKLFELASDDAFIKSLETNDERKGKLPLADKRFPIMRALTALVLTHHRLPSGVSRGGTIVANTGNLVRHDMAARLNQMKGRNKKAPNLFDIPKDRKPLWEEVSWISVVSEWAKRLAQSKVFEMDGDLLFKACSIHGRAALQLGDHKASALGKQRSLQPSFTLDASRLIANTNHLKKPAEYLSGHLESTRKRSRIAGPDIGLHKTSMQHVTRDEIPTSISSPSARKGTRFRWQVDASKATSSHLTKHAACGFFGVLMAGTGSGKTRAIPAIMAAAGGSLRYTLALGLRALTLQSGDAYIEECGFRRSDVGVIIGSEIAQMLYELKTLRDETNEENGTSAEDPIPEVVVTMDRDATPRLAPAVRYFLTEPDSIRKIGVPILATTIDTLMHAAHAKRGNHLDAMLRLATADLAIDEIDDYGDEDQAAIGRLVFLSGAFGRRVLLSSATLTPVTAKVLFQAYREGFLLHAALYGLEKRIDCGWYSDVEGLSKCVRIDAAAEGFAEFLRHHATFTDRIVQDLKMRPAVRKGATILTNGASTKQEYFSEVLKGITLLHDNTSFLDGATGRTLSIGFSRWNNVSPSIEFVEWLSAQNDPDTEYKIIPYNGRLLPAARYHIEKCLDELLTRKPLPNLPDPILTNPLVRKALLGSSKKNLCIVVVTTSLEEVGRDHDFDWAITEPMSQRSLIQMAGRVQRHRLSPCVKPNVGIMQKCLKDVLSGNTSSRTRPFANPGIESRIYGDHDPEIVFHLDDHDASVIYDIEKISERIDVTDVISVSEPVSKLARLERKKLESYLVDGVGRPLSPIHYATQQMALLTSYHADNRIFRRSTQRSYFFTLLFNGDAVHWLRQNTNTKDVDNVDCDFFPININENALFIEPTNLDEVVDHLARRMTEDGNITEFQRTMLLSVEMKLWDPAKARYRYHPWIGMADIESV